MDTDDCRSSRTQRGTEALPSTSHLLHLFHAVFAIGIAAFNSSPETIQEACIIVWSLIQRVALADLAVRALRKTANCGAQPDLSKERVTCRGSRLKMSGHECETFCVNLKSRPVPLQGK